KVGAYYMANTDTETEVKTLGKELTLDQQMELIREEIQRFVKMAKERGPLSIEEINELLQQEIIAPSVLDTFMQALEVAGVEFTDVSENKTKDEGEDGFLLSDPDKEDKEEEEEEAEVAEDTKSNDPVRLYLRKMGSVSLLTRE